jgi:hypothetical protein
MKKVIVITLLSVLVMSTFSCRKAGRGVAKVTSKAIVKKFAKLALGTAFLISVDELIASEMLDKFDEVTANPSKTGTSIIHNTHINELTIEVSKDGRYWSKQRISPDEPVHYATTGKGIASIHSGDGGYYLLQAGHEYAVSLQDDGTILVQEVER